jgi:flavin-dependent dehydrogenase
LKLFELIEEAGSVRAQTAAFFSETRSTASHPLPASAICLSRFALDAALAKRFRELGGELREGERSRIEDFGEGIVRATGRRVCANENGSRWFGLKIHARNVTLAADLEMHVSSRGYVGLCKINDGEVNVCGLFRKYADKNGESKNCRELLRGQPGSPLSERLTRAEFIENTFCAVAGISLRPRQAASCAEICIGDAISMIPPVSGNGMSMAFESAELAIEPLAAWSRNKLTWNEVRQKITRDCDARFARRLAWAKWLQRILLTPALQNPLIAFAARNEWFWRMAFERTR